MGNNHIKLIDQYNRRLNYLRISVTDRCNLRCLYCIPRGGVAKLGHKDILSYEEILRLARIAAGLGVQKIRVTGGEPLLRKGIFNFLPLLAALPGLEDLALTTNGIYLKENLENLRSSGIKRLNISLDSLRPEIYRRITGLDRFQAVWEAIRSAEKLGFDPIKINVVVIKGQNDSEILDFARLSLDHPYHIRFIEYMPIGTNITVLPVEHVSNSLVKSQLNKLGKLNPIGAGKYDGPAERFRFEGAPGEIGFISPLTDHFCHDCNRLRLTASGTLSLCLLSDREEDLKGPMRDGASDDDLTRIFVRAALNKPGAHPSASENSNHFSGQMSSIGG